MLSEASGLLDSLVFTPWLRENTGFLNSHFIDVDGPMEMSKKIRTVGGGDIMKEKRTQVQFV